MKSSSLIRYYELTLAQLRTMLKCASEEQRPYWAGEVAKIEARLQEVSPPGRVDKGAGLIHNASV